MNVNHKSHAQGPKYEPSVLFVWLKLCYDCRISVMAQYKVLLFASD